MEVFPDGDVSSMRRSRYHEWSIVNSSAMNSVNSTWGSSVMLLVTSAPNELPAASGILSGSSDVPLISRHMGTRGQSAARSTAALASTAPNP